jgi:hypothetical protein
MYMYLCHVRSDKRWLHMINWYPFALVNSAIALCYSRNVAVIPHTCTVVVDKVSYLLNFSVTLSEQMLIIWFLLPPFALSSGAQSR